MSVKGDYFNLVRSTYEVNYWRELCGLELHPIPDKPVDWGNATDVTIHGYPPVNRHQTTPGRLTLTIRGHA